MDYDEEVEWESPNERKLAERLRKREEQIRNQADQIKELNDKVLIEQTRTDNASRYIRRMKRRRRRYEDLLDKAGRMLSDVANPRPWRDFAKAIEEELESEEEGH